MVCKERLFPEFPPVSTEDWMAQITADLKGAPFEKKLIWETAEGFEVKPFYRFEDIEGMKTAASLPGKFPYIRGTKKGNDWKIRQDIEVTDFIAANRKAQDLLKKGVTSLGFHFRGDEVNMKNIASLLNDISPETIELNFVTCNHKAALLIQHLAGYFKSQNLDIEKCFGSVNYDPFKNPLIRGVEGSNWVETAAETLKAGKDLPLYRVLAVNACYLSNAGAYISQESGYALAWGNELIAKLNEAGFPADEIAKKIKFNFGISANYFMEIAKFRAVRWLWAEIVAAYKPVCQNDCPDNEPDGLCRCACKMRVHAQTLRWNQTIYDGYINLLRSQTEAMSAAIAGVDSITVGPFDQTYQTPDEFSERIARNQQLLLKEECHFDKVVDPSAGSYFIEVLTNSLARVAWNLFLETEDKGGFEKILQTGEIQRAVNDSSLSRKRAIATRRERLVGTNQFPDFTETASSKIKIEEDGKRGCGGGTTITPLDFSRGASEFEALRLETEKSGKTPKVFLLPIGNLTMRLARLQFARNFFACAGYQVIEPPGFDTVEAGIEASLKAEAHIVVLCSSDDEYAVFAPAAYKALQGKAVFVVAGAPVCMNDLKAQGIAYFISAKSNVLESLQEFNKLLFK